MPKPKNKKDNETPLTFREASFDVQRSKGEDGKEKVCVRVSVSSETPYLRWCWDEEAKDYVRGFEVLGHKEGEIDKSRMRDGLVIQDTHWGDQVGLMRSPEIKDGKISGEIEFCSGARAQEIKADAEKLLRRNMSVGYIVNKCERTGEVRDGYPVFRVTSWTPYEASFVNVPADTEVGVGRSADIPENPAANAPANKERKANMAEPEKKAEFKAAEVVECFRLARAANVEHAEVKEMIDSGKTFEEVRGALEDRLEKYQRELADKAAKRTAEPAKPGEVLDEAARREIGKRYSLVRALRLLSENKPVDGFEREISDEIAKVTGRSAQGFYAPACMRNYSAFAKGQSSAIVATDTLFGEFIEGLRDKLVLARAGMRLLPGLVGDIAIPKKTGKIQGSWISTEGGDAGGSNPSVGSVTGTPHTAGGYCDMTRKLLMQSGIPVEALVQDDLLAALAALIETAGFTGTGTNGAPTGLINLAGDSAISEVTFTPNAPTLGKLLECVAKLMTDNTDSDAAKWIMTPAVWAKIRATYDWQAVKTEGDTPAVVGGVSSGHYLADVATKTIEGYGYLTSNLTKAKELLFGDFSQLILAMWGGTDITVDPYSLSKSGGVRIVALQDVDFLCRHAKAFVRGKTVIS